MSSVYGIVWNPGESRQAETQGATPTPSSSIIHSGGEEGVLKPGCVCWWANRQEIAPLPGIEFAPIAEISPTKLTLPLLPPFGAGGIFLGGFNCLFYALMTEQIWKANLFLVLILAPFYTWKERANCEAPFRFIRSI